jgi:hypothetical protein
MKHLRQYIRHILLEDLENFKKDVFAAAEWSPGSDLFRRVKHPSADGAWAEVSRSKGRFIKSKWAKHVDRNFIDSLIYVSYLGYDDFVRKSDYLLKPTHKNEISCEAFSEEKYIKFVGYHGDIGLIIKGYVTLLSNDQDELYTGTTDDYRVLSPDVSPDIEKTSGINKGVSYGYTEDLDHYALDKESFFETTAYTNEALLDNWSLQAIFTRDPAKIIKIKNLLKEKGFDHIPVLNPMVDDMSKYTNK